MKEATTPTTRRNPVETARENYLRALERETTRLEKRRETVRASLDAKVKRQKGLIEEMRNLTNEIEEIDRQLAGQKDLFDEAQ